MPLLFSILAVFVLLFQAASAQQAPLPVTKFWLQEIPEYLSGKEDGFVIKDVLSSATGQTILLALNNQQASLFFGSNKDGPGTEVPLLLTGSVIRLAEGRDRSLWAAGLKNFRFSGLRQWYQSDAYVAKLDSNGRLVWEHEFSTGTQRDIQSIRILASGDAIVAGRDDEKIWLARISQNGSLVWERLFGAAKGVSLELADNEVVVVGFDWAEGASDRAYREDVVAWKFGEDGDLRNRLVIRHDISTERRSYFGSVLTLASPDAIYALSSWNDTSAIKMWEVVKITPSFEIDWRKSAEDVAYRHGARPVPCRGAAGFSEKGDPLFLCTTGEEISLWKISPQDGKITKAVSQPVVHFICPSGWAAPVLFFFTHKNGSIEVFGTRPQGGRSTSCTWFGQLGAPN